MTPIRGTPSSSASSTSPGSSSLHVLWSPDGVFGHYLPAEWGVLEEGGGLSWAPRAEPVTESARAHS